ncbi:HAD family phosphatase [Bradyrhizobium manausense]|nr:HAD family phosphatase [Bradyrhizobium manausense]
MKVYLFDLDGTLAASEPLKARALANACASYGVEADHLIYADVMGADWKTVTAHFFSTYRLNPPLDEFDARFREYYLDLIEAEVTETRGASGFVRESRKRGIRVGVVSSAAPWMVERVLSKLELSGAFDLVVTQEDVTSHKPDPEAYLLVLSRLRTSAAETLVFEDSYAGLKAANAAGCNCIVVRHAFNGKHDFSAALRVIDGFSEFHE